MSAAAVEMQEYDEVPEPPALLKQQVAEKLAAHRLRRAKGEALAAKVVDGGGSLRSQKIASAVAERYAQTQSYREFLAAEAEEATRKARAVAEVAARTAEAVATAQRELMEELAGSASRVVEVEALTAAVEEIEVPVVQISRAGLSVRLFEDVGRRAPVEDMRRAGTAVEDSEETRALDEEISFRQAPTFELEQPSVAIPGNLLEFPRQLVAARKARPRYAEGPLLEEAGHDGTQLRIFEVEAEQMTEAAPVESAAPEWSSIWLDALAASAVEAPAEALEAAPAVKLEVASMERRVMAAMVDGCLVGAAFVGLATVFAYRAAVLPSMGVAAVASAGCLGALFLLYEMLFFTLAEATPGMRYARIGLCTFQDENPSRAAMRKRLGALLIAACPVGLGFLWAWVDRDRLGWHDRISQIYQREY